MKLDLSARQIEILEASGKILMEKGVWGLTTKNLAQKMNFSESALYRHFKDKEEIITHLISYLSESINLRFERILENDMDEKAKLMELFRSQFAFFKQNPHFIVIVLSEGIMDNSENVKNEILKLMQTNATAFKKIITQGQANEIFKQEIEAEHLVHFVMGSFRLQMLKWKLSDFSFDIEKKGMETMHNLIKLIQ